MTIIMKIIGISLGVIFIILIGIISDKAVNITGTLISIYTLILIYKERKTANYNQKTIELRNEMYAVSNRICNMRTQLDGTMILDNKIKDSKNQILYLYQKIKKHGNESLLREFCLSDIAERILKSTIDHDFADLQKEIKDTVGSIEE